MSVLSTNSHTMLKITRKSEQPFRLVPSKSGRHRFGGVCDFSGAVPSNSGVPVQQLLLIDLTDPAVPFATEPVVTELPLLYPFKYGSGGPEIQYALRSANSVEILYLSDPDPDEPQYQYIQVDALPSQQLELVPLTYEEARCLVFLREDGYFQPNQQDRMLLESLDLNNLIKLGGRRNHISNAPEIICRNPGCARNGERTMFHFIAMVPPIPVNGGDEFWYAFQGGDVDFCFGFCYSCGTIIGFNVAS